MKNLSKYLLKNKIKVLYLTGALFLAFSFFFGIALGSTRLSLSEISDSVIHGFDFSAGTRIFAFSRLPRTLGAMVSGAALAVSGCVIQAVLGNKLASPSVIGVNSGAGLATTLCTSFGIWEGITVSLCAFSGAVVSVVLVSLCALKWGRSKSTVILIGVALNSFFSAVSEAIVTFNPEVGLMSRDFKIGDLSSVRYPTLIPALVISVSVIILLILLSRHLDLFSLGEDRAHSLGMNTLLARAVFLILSALLAGCAVSVAGLLSFVGLIVPHAVRRFSGNTSGRLIPLCAIFGAGFVTLSDTLSRLVFAPYEIPVGVIMAFLGAPFFVFILVKRRETV